MEQIMSLINNSFLCSKDEILQYIHNTQRTALGPSNDSHTKMAYKSILLILEHNIVIVQKTIYKKFYMDDIEVFLKSENFLFENILTFTDELNVYMQLEGYDDIELGFLYNKLKAKLKSL